MTSTKVSKPKTLVGWIAALPEDRQFLEKLGVDVVGPYDEHEKHYNVQLAEEVLDRLDPYWGKFYWSLKEWQ